MKKILVLALSVLFTDGLVAQEVRFMNLFRDSSGYLVPIGGKPLEVSSLISSGVILSEDTLVVRRTKTDVKVGDIGGHHGVSAFTWNNDSESPVFRGLKARGTRATPDTVETGDYLVALTGMGYNGAAGWLTQSSVVAIIFRAEEQFTSTSTPTRIDFMTTESGSVDKQTVMRLTSDANLRLGYRGANTDAILHFIEDAGVEDGWNIRHKGSDNSLRFSNVIGGTDWVQFSQTGSARFGNVRATTIDSTGGIGGSNAISDTAAFSGSATRLAVYIAGATSTDKYVAQGRVLAGVGAETLPVDGDNMYCAAKTDSLIILRQAGTTSNLKVQYIRIK